MCSVDCCPAMPGSGVTVKLVVVLTVGFADAAGTGANGRAAASTARRVRAPTVIEGPHNCKSRGEVHSATADSYEIGTAAVTAVTVVRRSARGVLPDQPAGCPMTPGNGKTPL